MDPVTLLNQERGHDFEVRLKAVEEDLKYISKEKQMLNE